MKRKEAAILLTPGRLEFVVLSGKQGERGIVTALDPSAWETAWGGGLRAFDSALGESVGAMDASGCSVSVFHAGPDAMVQMFSLPGKRNIAESAARLALSEHCGRVLEGTPHSVSFIGQDAEGDPSLTHFLGCSDGESSARMISDWIGRAGLVLSRIAPVEAGTLAALASAALERTATGVDVRLRIGEDGSALVASERGSIRMLRPVDVDLGVLVEAMTRSIVRDEGRGGTVALTHGEARQMLFEIGLPERDTVVDAARSIRGSDILALISPVLQRCIVQVRQTLRFGLDEGARTHARLRVEGPGSRIPGLAEMISEETGLPLDGVGETGAAFDAPGHPDGDLMTAVRSTPRDVNLVPGDVARCQRERRMKWTLAAGVAIAFGAIGIDASMTEMAFRGTRDELRRVSASAETAKSLLELRTDVEQEKGALGAVLASAKTAVGDRVAWSALLREIAAASPSDIKIQELTASRDGAGATLTMRAYLVSKDRTTPDPEGVRAFLETLGGSALCESVAMGETQRSMLEHRGALQFTATILPRTLPLTVTVAEETE